MSWEEGNYGKIGSEYWGGGSYFLTLGVERGGRAMKESFEYVSKEKSIGFIHEPELGWTRKRMDTRVTPDSG